MATIFSEVLSIRLPKGKMENLLFSSIEGSIPDEHNKKEGYWASLRHGFEDRPADYYLRMDRSPGAARLGGGGGGNLRHLWRHSRHGR
jgi:hypothetical protein